MPLDAATLVRQALQLHADTVARWHDEPLDNPYTGLLGVVCQQHQYNFQLWHEEDIARSPDAGRRRRSPPVKRAIDGFNQQRQRLDRTDRRDADPDAVDAARRHRAKLTATL